MLTHLDKFGLRRQAKCETTGYAHDCGNRHDCSDVNHVLFVLRVQESGTVKGGSAEDTSDNTRGGETSVRVSTDGLDFLVFFFFGGDVDDDGGSIGSTSLVSTTSTNGISTTGFRLGVGVFFFVAGDFFSFCGELGMGSGWGWDCSMGCGVGSTLPSSGRIKSSGGCDDWPPVSWDAVLASTTGVST